MNDARHRTLLVALMVGQAATPGGASEDATRTIPATGVVYHDHDGDSERDEGERGIPGVLVSDGRSVVRTDADGRYRLEIDAEDAIVFVVKPRDFQVELDSLNLPRGYYIHKPGGSPDEGFVFGGVEPTGPLPSSIDFGLTASPEPSRFSVVAFGDPQPYSLQQIDYFRQEVIDPLIASDGNAHGAAFGISLGDLVGDNLDLFHPLNDAQAMLGVPWYNVYGNHDMNFMSGGTDATAGASDRYADETFERVYGPPNYAFQYGDVHFIVLDNVYWQGFDGFRDGTDPNWPTPQKPSTGNYRGALTQAQLGFIDGYLDHVPEDELVVLAFHIPMEMDGEGVHRIPEKNELLRILSSHSHTLSLSGHTHFQRHWFFGPEDGYRPSASGGINQHVALDPQRFPDAVHHHINAVTASGSWYNGVPDEAGVPHTTMRDGAPNGYTVLTFDGNRYTSEFRAARRPASDQMGIVIGDLAGDTAPDVAGPGATPLAVNIYNGAKGDNVEFRIVPNPSTGAAATSWQSLRHDPRPDPRYAATHAREAAMNEAMGMGRGLPRPQVCHHLWSGSIPGGLPAGTHAVEVRHTDLYGHDRVGRRTFRVND